MDVSVKSQPSLRNRMMIRGPVHKVVGLVVDGLFGHVQHRIKFRDDAPTLLTGPNGVGKTHVLDLLSATLNSDVRGVASIPFRHLRVDLSNGYALEVTRLVDDESISLSTRLERNGRQVGDILIIENADEDRPEDQLPEYLKRTADGRWLDTRSGRFSSRTMVERRYNVALDDKAPSLFAETPGKRLPSPVMHVISIDTKRLDNPSADALGRLRRNDTYATSAEYAVASARAAATRIEQYIERINMQVIEARRASVRKTQFADLSFASRALAAAHARVNFNDLRDRYAGIAEQYEELSRNGLATGDAPLAFPDEANPTARRILKVFLDDWESRLEPLLPVSEKLGALRRILNGRMAATGKRAVLNERGVLGFRDHLGRPVRVDSLSSGEQHLVALFTLLLFSTSAGSLVLIDEPELSMHAAWKHAFLRDVADVAQLTSMQVVLATHSTGIVNGRWDLVEELKAPFYGKESATDIVDLSDNISIDMAVNEETEL